MGNYQVMLKSHMLLYINVLVVSLESAVRLVACIAHFRAYRYAVRLLLCVLARLRVLTRVHAYVQILQPIYFCKNYKYKNVLE